MKKLLVLSIILMLIAGVMFIDSHDLMTPKVYANEISTENQNTIEVYGKATLEVEPDIAYINIGVNSESKDPAEAQNENKEKMTKIISALKDQGITDDALKTLNYNIRKNYTYPKDGDRIETYVVSNILKVTIEDLSKVGQMIDVSSKAGANNINSIRFALKDDSMYYNEALALAIDNADSKAKTLLEAVGGDLNQPKSIVELSSNNGFYRDSNISMKAEMAYDSVQTPIESGDITVTAQLKVIYEY